MESITEKRELFRHYYSKSYPVNRNLLDLKFRHFRFQLFSKKVTFRRILDIINSPEQLRDKLISYVPLNAYFTPVKWLSPIYVGHTKNVLEVMLSAPLYFDIDMQDLFPPVFSEVKRNTLLLLEILEEEYSQRPDLIVFSGRQGFHIYFWKWDMPEILKLNPASRVIEFKKQRSIILEIVRRKKVVVDERITADPFRIMKIPNTLHGKTGLIAKPVKEVEKFDPKTDAQAFDREVYERLFRIDWGIYD
ncbi:MAG: DNA primase small subunit domain-containing protein [Candidatus Bathyarchaeia archaeon]